MGRQHGGSDRFGEGQPRLLAAGSQCGTANQLGVLRILPLGFSDRWVADRTTNQSEARRELKISAGNKFLIHPFSLNKRSRLCFFVFLNLISKMIWIKWIIIKSFLFLHPNEQHKLSLKVYSWLWKYFNSLIVNKQIFFWSFQPNVFFIINRCCFYSVVMEMVFIKKQTDTITKW